MVFCFLISKSIISIGLHTFFTLLVKLKHYLWVDSRLFFIKAIGGEKMARIPGTIYRYKIIDYAHKLDELKIIDK